MKGTIYKNLPTLNMIFRMSYVIYATSILQFHWPVDLELTNVLNYEGDNFMKLTFFTLDFIHYLI